MPSHAVQSLALSRTPAEVAASCRHLEGFVFLDSSDADETRGSCWSLITALPHRWHRGHLSRPEALRTVLAKHDRRCIDWGFPTGGLFGAVDYDGRYLFGEYHHLLVFDHHNERWFRCGDPPFLQTCQFDASSVPAHPQPARISFQSTMTRAAFVERVRKAQAWIAQGDIYQVNLSHQFEAHAETSPQAIFAVYSRLRDLSPAPYAAFVDQGRRQILSSSPECFLRMSGRGVVTRPIKGTRPRFSEPIADERSAYDLLTSEKEIAELIMITDLERNDLGQVCDYGSVRVSELLELERYSQVFHLVSTVEGRIRPENDQVEVLRKCFPGGSITGAPKKRSMEIIDILEPVPRGLYTGAIGYLGWNGESQFSIAIRTLLHEGGRWHFHVGAGIVADSDPEAEYAETLHKAAGILAACGTPRAEGPAGSSQVRRTSPIPGSRNGPNGGGLR